jgi:hypothetical protein
LEIKARLLADLTITIVIMQVVDVNQIRGTSGTYDKLSQDVSEKIDAFAVEAKAAKTSPIHIFNQLADKNSV